MTTPEDKDKNRPKDVATIPPGRPKDVITIPPGKPKDVDTISPGRPEDIVTIQPGKEGGQELYLRLMTEQLTGWDNPRAMLERALLESQFLLLAQKILPLKSGGSDPVCYEVLLRLKQEEDNLLPPGGFLDIADSLGMMEKIDLWVVHALLSWGAARLKNNPAYQVPMMCVNVSTSALTDPAFANAVREELRRFGVPPRTLCFEINERDIIENHASVQAFISALKPAGCHFTVDSFGSVRVSFSHLKGLALDFVKIDGIVIQNIAHDPLALATAKAISIVCQDIGIRTIAEFVETRKTLDRLREIGVNYVQGFGISRPKPISKIALPVGSGTA